MAFAAAVGPSAHERSGAHTAVVLPAVPHDARLRTRRSLAKRQDECGRRGADHAPPTARIVGRGASRRQRLRASRPTMTDRSDLLREPVRGGVAYPGLAALPGREQVEALLAGRAPAPPVARLTGRRIVAASHGSATCALRATDWMLGPKGFVHRGVLAFLADGALIATVVSGLPARVLCTTAERSMTFLESLPSGGGEITARVRLLHVDEQMALAEVYVRHGDRLAAHGTSRCSVFPPIDESIQLLPPDESAAADTEPATPDPYLREPPVVDRGGTQHARDGVELLRAQLRGELPRPPIDHLTGLRLVDAEPGRVVFALPEPLAAQRVGHGLRGDPDPAGRVGRGRGRAGHRQPRHRL